MISNEERLRFDAICKDIAEGELCPETIGTYSEKRMHRTLKRFFCDDESCHEVRIRPDGGIGSTGESGRGGYIADIFREGEIIEIQTASFYPLREKLKFYIENTDYIVTVVHPVAKRKYLTWIDVEDGSIASRRLSPKKERVVDVLPELYWISEMLGSDRLHFCFPIVEAEEFRLLNGWSRDKKRGSDRYECVPTELLDLFCIAGKDVAGLLPEDIPDEFTGAEFGRIMGFKGRKLYSAINLFCALGVVKKCEKRGRSFIYRIVTKI